ncbi:MAG: FAD binding domain-containing protein [Gammaproteobacteria bacterium]
MAEPDFHQPATVGEAVELLAQAGEEGRALAGGATLVALMNARLVEPRCLVSLANIEELRTFGREPDGTVRIGAMRCHRETAFESDLRDGQRVVSLAASQIANPPVRNMGTIGGSIAFADPAADYPPALVAANAVIEIAGPGGRRAISAEAFFLGWYETALEPGEIVTAVILAPAEPDSIGHYEKLCRVSGDFALASIALVMSLSPQRTVAAVRIAVGGCGGGPIRVPAAEQAMLGGALDAASIAEAGRLLQGELDPVDDVRGSASYRTKVVPRLLKSALDATSAPAMDFR